VVDLKILFRHIATEGNYEKFQTEYQHDRDWK